MNLREYQKECISAMENTTDKFNILNLFCGTGKTKIYTEYLIKNKHEISIITFPRISLVDQYNKDYYENTENYAKLSIIYKKYIISSEHNSIGDKRELLDFITNKHQKNKLIFITHSSFPLLCDILHTNNIKVSSIIIDEVHHFESKSKIKLINSVDTNNIFGFTATMSASQMKINNGIPLYKYGYCEALRDGFCKQFEIDLYITSDKKTPDTIYKALFFIAEKFLLKNILCFHGLSEADAKNNRTSVKDFKNIKIDINKESFFKKIVSYSITGKMKNSERLDILNKICNGLYNELYILHTCNTISEGIDTKAIKAISFIDAKGSIISILQALGRITRIDGTDIASRVIIPLFDIKYNAEDDEYSGEGLIEIDDINSIISKESITMTRYNELTNDKSDSINNSNTTSLGIDNEFYEDNLYINKFNDNMTDDSDNEDIVRSNTKTMSDNILNKTNVELVNESSYKIILKILEFLKEENPSLLNAALNDPHTLTKYEYEYHFDNVIINKDVGTMYIGKNISEIKESNVIICTSELGGEVYKLNDFFSEEKTIRKELNTDKWIYLYTDNNIVKDTLGETNKIITKKPKKIFVVSQLDEKGNIIHESSLLKSINKDKGKRLDKIKLFCKSVIDNRTVPIKSDKLYGGYYNTLKQIKTGNYKKNPIFTLEENEYLETFFKTKDWNNITREVFNNHIDDFFNPNVTTIEYKVLTRLDKIKLFCKTIIDNRAIPLNLDKPHGKFFDTLKQIKTGNDKKNPDFTPEENKYLETFFKTKDWNNITKKVFNNHIDDFFDSDIINIEYKVKLKKIKDDDGNKISPYETKQLDLIKKYFSNKDEIAMKKIKQLQYVKNKTSKAFTLYNSTDIFLTSISTDWSNIKPEKLYNLYNLYNNITELVPVMSSIDTEVVTIQTNNKIPYYENKQLELVKKYFSNKDEIAMKKIKQLQSAKNKTSKTFTLYNSTDIFLTSISTDWSDIKPEKLYDLYNNIKPIEPIKTEPSKIEPSNIKTEPSNIKTIEPIKPIKIEPIKPSKTKTVIKLPHHESKQLDCIKLFFENKNDTSVKKLKQLQNIKNNKTTVGNLYDSVEVYLSNVDINWQNKTIDELYNKNKSNKENRVIKTSDKIEQKIVKNNYAKDDSTVFIKMETSTVSKIPTLEYNKMALVIELDEAIINNNITKELKDKLKVVFTKKEDTLDLLIERVGSLDAFVRLIIL